jgi:hypothetical protein
VSKDFTERRLVISDPNPILVEKLTEVLNMTRIENEHRKYFLFGSLHFVVLNQRGELR